MRDYILIAAVVCAATTTAFGADGALLAGPRLGAPGGAAAAPTFGATIGEIGGVRVHLGTPAAAALYAPLLERRGDGGGGDVANVEVLQTDYTDPEAGNVVLIIWDETVENQAGVRVTLIDGEGTVLGSLETPGQDPAPPDNLVFLSQVPEGVHTFRVTSLDDDSESEASMLIVAEQPFGDVTNLTCREGVAAPAGDSCQLIIEWEPAALQASWYLIVVNDVPQATVDGAQDLLILDGAPPADYTTRNIGFLDIEDGLYRGQFIDTTCTLTCTEDPCEPPSNLSVCQVAYGTDPQENELRIDWVNFGDYSSVDVYLDGAGFDSLPGSSQDMSLLDIDPGAHTIAIEGVCLDGGATDQVEDTIVVMESTPHVNPIADVVMCEWSPDNGNGSPVTRVSWTNADPSVYIDVFVLSEDGVPQGLGRIGGASESVSVTNATESDVIALQFFAELETGCYASELISCRGPGNAFIRGVCNGVGGTPQITSAVFGLNYLFAGGAEPPCVLACDFDADSSVAINDLIGVLTYLFQGGAPPAGWIDGEPRCEEGPVDSCQTANPACPL